jgi:nicotinamide-nucleotide amidase
VIAEVVSVGTELLLGEIVDTNAAEIARSLGEWGYDAHFRVTVGDNHDRIVAVLRQACSRADVVVVTGGIGPTQDDLTKEALCTLAGVAMVRDDRHAEVIRRVVMSRRGSMRASVLRMADLPAGSEPLPNAAGLALGAALTVEGVLVLVLPGVPGEMRVMLEEQVAPRLVALSGGRSVRSCVVRTEGLGESEVAHRLDDLYARTNPSIAFRIHGGQVHVRVTAQAASGAEAEAMAEELAAEVRARLQDALV